MVADEQIAQRRSDRPEVSGASTTRQVWCYLVSLRGALYALPDEPGAPLLPHINRLGHVTPLPVGLAPPYVLGLVNMGQQGELMVDLGAYLGLPGERGDDDLRRQLLVGEQPPRGSHDAYRLAFVVDTGYELTPLACADEDGGHGAGNYVRELIDTPRGTAAVLDMAAICADIVRALGTERAWSAPVKGYASPKGEKE